MFACHRASRVSRSAYEPLACSPAGRSTPGARADAVARPPCAAGTRRLLAARRCAPGRGSTRPRPARRRTCRTSSRARPQRDRVAERLAVEVRLDPPVDRQRAGARVGAVQGDLVVHDQRGRGDQLERRAGRVLRRRSRGRAAASFADGAVSCCVVGVGDPADEQLRVVGRVAGHGEDPAGVAGPSPRPRRTVAGLPALRGSAICCASDCSASRCTLASMLVTSVSPCVAGTLSVGADRVALRVQLHDLLAVDAAQHASYCSSSPLSPMVSASSSAGLPPCRPR